MENTQTRRPAEASEASDRLTTKPPVDGLHTGDPKELFGEAKKSQGKKTEPAFVDCGVPIGDTAKAAAQKFGGSEKSATGEKSEQGEKHGQSTLRLFDSSMTAKAPTAGEKISKQEHLGQFREAKAPTKSFEPGEHKNANGSSHTANEKGQITEFSTGATQDNPKGLEYKNIRYDEKGNLKSYQSPSGQKA